MKQFGVDLLPIALRNRIVACKDWLVGHHVAQKAIEDLYGSDWQSMMRTSMNFVAFLHRSESVSFHMKKCQRTSRAQQRSRCDERHVSNMSRFASDRVRRVD